MGGGALSSNVSKLGSKEVSKICHLERSERFQSSVILRLSPQNDDTRHPELVSGSQMHDKCDVRSRNCVRDDRYLFDFFNPCHRALIARSVSRLHKHVAFTLAEVLITLGIIGVVASLTIGSVVNNIQKKELQTQFLKTTSQLQQAVKSMEANGESIDPRSYKDWDKGLFYNTFANYIKHIKTCKGNTNVQHPCYNKEKNVYYTPNGNTLSYAYLDDGQIVLPDGTLLLFENESHGTSSFKVYIFADLNGINKKPNKLGYDLFAYQLINNQLLPMGSEGTDYVGEQYCSKNSYGMSCTQKALEDKDYFKNLKRNN